MPKEYRFVITGGIDVDDTLKPITNDRGDVIAFELPNGTQVVPIFALLSDEGETYASELDINDLGLRNLGYDETYFEETK